jgi:hypothetical protein
MTEIAQDIYGDTSAPEFDEEGANRCLDKSEEWFGELAELETRRKALQAKKKKAKAA